MKNYIITLIGVSALALAFTGCGGSAGSVDSSTQAQNQVTQTQNKPTQATTSVATDTVKGLQQFPEVPAIPE